ncbi:hypothetical protein ElyMa_004484600, partial [Elysia marginata]
PGYETTITSITLKPRLRVFGSGKSLSAATGSVAQRYDTRAEIRRCVVRSPAESNHGISS